MTLVDFYLVCFVTGSLLSVVSFVLGNLHVHFHLPFHIHIAGIGDAPHVGHVHAHTGASGLASDLPYINFGTVTAFLAWFGGIGYLLSRHAHFYALTAFAISVAAGFCGSVLVFLLLRKLLMAHDHPLDSMDYDMIGVLGRVTSTIRGDGVGEIVFSQEGVRRSSGARSESGQPIAKGDEVVVTHYEKGIAFVRRWEELAASGPEQSALNSER
jgi:membrane protein implicated in regulation of membrane protease activity